MNEVTHLRLQAWLDGELSASEAEAMAKLHATDPELRRLADGLAATRDALRQNEPPRALPLSGDFFWSQVQNRILLGERFVAKRSARPSWMGWVYRLCVPAGAALLLGLLLVPLLRAPANQEMAAFSIETSAPGASVLAFHSEAEGITVVWLDTP